VLPFWVFLIIALYLYFVPIGGAGKVSAPFFVLLLISLFEEQGIIGAIIFAAIFYFIILIRDLIIIDRRSAYEVLVLALSYLLLRNFFLTAGGSFNVWSLIYSMIVACAVSAMVASFIKNFSAAPEATDTSEFRSFRRMLGWMIFFITWQLLIVGLFLPLDFLYQSSVVFLVAVILIDLVPQYVFGELTRAKVLATGSILFSLLTIVAASARWTL